MYHIWKFHNRDIAIKFIYTPEKLNNLKTQPYVQLKNSHRIKELTIDGRINRTGEESQNIPNDYLPLNKSIYSYLKLKKKIATFKTGIVQANRR